MKWLSGTSKDRSVMEVILYPLGNKLNTCSLSCIYLWRRSEIDAKSPTVFQHAIYN